MPELPEVEITRRCLEPWLVDRKIERVQTTRPSYLFITPPRLLQKRLCGRTPRALERRGKYLIARLDDESSLVLHLGMTGQLFVSGVSSVRLLSAGARSALSPEQQLAFRPDAHTHLRLTFADGGREVMLRDVRKFGKLLWLAPGTTHERLERQGPDALEADGEHLFRVTRGRRVAIKSLLLDQAVLAGVGNIYADEALYLAGVRPTRRAARVTRREADALADAVRHVLGRSIETGGSSISDFVAPDGRDGAYQDERHVYARTGEACTACQTPIKRIVVGARGTHYCPRCQP
jgi:formamidopyrimidine-DNA glycosylase